MIAYFDCFSGISGDMTLAAFIELGVPAEWLANTIRRALGIEFEFTTSPVSRMGISGLQVHVSSSDRHARHYSSIKALIEESSLNDAVKGMSIRMFDLLAEAESKIHGCSKDEVHFHEIGAVDSIVDIVGAALCVDYLKIESATASKIPLGSGTVTCAHGTIPVPAPAALEILKGVPVYGTEVQGELVTPTGASIIKTLAREFGPPPEMRVSGTGYGAGSREYEGMPNMLRVMTGTAAVPSERVVLMETSIDDMSPEVHGYLAETLMDEGALDVCMIPAYMKKNRPGVVFQVLCRPGKREALMNRIFEETTTLGIRCYDVNRRVLERETVEIETVYGSMEAKQVRMPDGKTRIIPEYEACKRAAEERRIPLRNVYKAVCLKGTMP